MFDTVSWHRRKLASILMLGFLLVLTACGDDGSDGDPGKPAGVDISNAGELNGTINRVRISSPPVVDFSLSDGNGNPVKNLPASAVSFKIAKLIPGTNGNASAWQSYINEIEDPGVGPGTESKVQATTENGSAGTFVDNDDGSYTYTFALDVTNVVDPVPVSYQPGLTHRVSLEVRGYAALPNPVYDFRPSDDATTGLFTREIAKTGTCNVCHENLSLHGGARFEMQDCVTCHNPGSADANSGNTVDMTVMTHKIHYGEDLPSVGMGTDYCIYGFNDRIHCYGDVAHPQDIRNCVNCHDADDTDTPDASNWYTQPTAEACGACHDDVNFETGANHRGIPADNTQCVTCHASNPNSSIEVRQAHRILEVEGAAAYSFNIISITYDGFTMTPRVRFSVTDPTNGDAPYDLATDPELKASPLAFYVAWNTVDYSNAGSGNNNAGPKRTDVYSGGVLQATDNMDFTYSMDLGTVAAGVTGSGVVTFEGQVVRASGNLPVTTAHRYFTITGDPLNPTPRRSSVDIERCNDCHELTRFHDTRNNSIESCQVCHHADAARGGTRGPMDMKHFLHRRHAVDTDVRYPQRIENCKACHTDDGFYPVSAFSGVLATSTDRGSDPLVPRNNTRKSPNSAVCEVCHTGNEAQLHMEQNGGSLDACQDENGVITEKVTNCDVHSGAVLQETCVTCHGAGRISDVATAHDLD